MFYSKLNDFFEIVGEKYQTKIIIAADPKSNYENNPFKNIRIIKYQTHNLIKKSRFVISHASTSNYSAILLNKNLILITSNEMKGKIPSLHNAIITFSFKFNLKVFNLDSYDKNYIIDFENVNFNHKFIKKYLINYKYYNKANSIIIKDYINNLV